MHERVWILTEGEPYDGRLLTPGEIINDAIDHLELFWNVEFDYFNQNIDDPMIRMGQPGEITRPLEEVLPLLQDNTMAPPDAVLTGQWHSPTYGYYPATPEEWTPWPQRVITLLEESFYNRPMLVEIGYHF
jgi:hypothetical protein